MYMDQNESRSGRDRAQGELYRMLAQNGTGGSNMPCHKMTRGCDSRPISGDFRGNMMARGELISGGSGNVNGGCGCTGENGNGVIGNAYPCGENGVEGRSLAMVYASLQPWRNTYDPATALRRGTLFRELDLPFIGGEKTDRGGNCRGY